MIKPYIKDREKKAIKKENTIEVAANKISEPEIKKT